MHNPKQRQNLLGGGWIYELGYPPLLTQTLRNVKYLALNHDHNLREHKVMCHGKIKVLQKLRCSLYQQTFHVNNNTPILY